jgi:threonylcarbamoyladenosine tRNA methylthiotransferase MtaB
VSGVRVLTLGCRLNTYESETMRRAAETAGLNNAILVNTCAVTADAVRQARQTIRRARRDNPHARIVVSGCAAQVEPETFAAMDEVDAVIGNDAKGRAATYRSLPDFGVSHSEKIRVNDIMSVRETAPQMIEAVEGHARAFVQVQNGCDHRCTFCIIPYGRGNSRSVPMGRWSARSKSWLATATRKSSSPVSTPPATAPTCREARRSVLWPGPFSNRCLSSSDCGFHRSIRSRWTRP